MTNQSEIKEAVNQVIKEFGRIDVLVNNAGYGIFGSLEETTDEETRAIFDTNVFARYYPICANRAQDAL